MNTKCACILLLAVLACSAEAYEYENKENRKDDVVEARGKAKFALLIHFFYVVATKLFVLKIVYGAIFYALIVKGWHFVSWFIHYLKEKKSHDHHEYVELDHEPYHHGHHYGHDHDHYGQDNHGHNHYGHDNYGPYAYDKQGYGGNNGFKNYGYSSYSKKGMYDADGSYSVKS